MGYFPSLQGTAKELYEQVKNHENYKDIIRCIELDECLKSLDQERGEKWIVSHAAQRFNWKNMAKYQGRNVAYRLLEYRILDSQRHLFQDSAALEELLSTWDEYEPSKDCVPSKGD